MNNDLNEIIKALKYLMEATEEDELIPLAETEGEK